MRWGGDFLGIFKILVGTVELALPRGCNFLYLIVFIKKGFYHQEDVFSEH